MPTFPKFLVINDNIQFALLQKAVTASIMAAAIENRIHARAGSVQFINPNTTIEALEDFASQLNAMSETPITIPEIDMFNDVDED